MAKWLTMIALIFLSGCTGINDFFGQGTDEGEVVTTGDADVTFVRAVNTGDNTWTFHVTVQHPDTGWEDYADGWDVILPDDTPIIPNSGDA